MSSRRRALKKEVKKQEAALEREIASQQEEAALAAVTKVNLDTKQLTHHLLSCRRYQNHCL